MKRFINTILFLLLFAITLSAQIQLSDSTKVSLLTASPWNGAVYAYYGHTAIWVQDDSTGLDAVFNYGYFDTSIPNFMWHFAKGETDYVLGVTSITQFLQEYGRKGQEVFEQELNLSIDEKRNLFDALYINALPENRRYRYNYFFDNCATRPRDMIEKYTSGDIQYPPTAKEQSYRDLLHECLKPYPWNRFGIDIILGADADKIIDVRQKMFIPEYLKNSYSGAVIVDSTSVPLVKNELFILSVDNKYITKCERTIFSPLIVAFALLLLTILVSFYQRAKLGKTILPKIYDTILFGIAGIAGVVIFFMMFFSEHPATGRNWNFVWLNLFALIFAILFWVKQMKKMVIFYHFINFAVLTLFLIFWWLIPQDLPLATIPFSMCLWIRSGASVIVSRKKASLNRRYVSSKHLKAGWGG